MNGTVAALFVSDCPLEWCHWTSDPLPGEDAAREARRLHVSRHTQGELVEYVCASRVEVTRYAAVPA